MFIVQYHGGKEMYIKLIEYQELDRFRLVIVNCHTHRNLPTPFPQQHTYKILYAYTYKDRHLKGVLGNP